MPNIVAHALVAGEAFPTASPNLIFGSTLPDFLGMYNDYYGALLKPRHIQEPPDLVEGIALHLRTDRIFDDLSTRNKLLAEGRDDCVSNIPALSRGAIRALADVGTDLLLDTALLEQERGQEAYRRLKDDVLEERTALNLTLPKVLVSLVRDFFLTDRPEQYRDMEWMAGMLQQRLSLRIYSRLSFDAALTLRVAEMFERQLARVRGAANALVALTVEGITSDNT